MPPRAKKAVPCPGITEGIGLCAANCTHNPTSTDDGFFKGGEATAAATDWPNACPPPPGRPQNDGRPCGLPRSVVRADTEDRCDGPATIEPFNDSCLAFWYIGG